MSSQLESPVIEKDCYRLLNIPREATNEEITSAYRKYSRVFHPDKHSPDEETKKWAEGVFHKIKEAHDVLTDPDKRAIYDIMEKEGLEVEGWQLIRSSRTPKAMREEFEKLKERGVVKPQCISHHKSIITFGLNAKDFMKTNVYDKSGLPDYRAIELANINISHNIFATPTIFDMFIMNTTLDTTNGKGTGIVTMTYRHLVTPRHNISAEGEVKIGPKPYVSMKIYSQLSKRLFLFAATKTILTPQGIALHFSSTITMEWNKHCTGYLTCNMSKDDASLAATYSWSKTRLGNTCTDVHIGKQHTYMGLTYSCRPMAGLELHVTLKYGTYGALVEYGAENKINSAVKLLSVLSFGLPTGVTLQLKLVYGTQKIVLPIQLSDEVLASRVLYGTAVPMLLWVVLKKLCIDRAPKKEEEKK